ncbi:hypothetical protein AAC387_Pa07g0156 [Persea americana]
MALDAVVFAQELFGYGCSKDIYSLAAAAFSCDDFKIEEEEKKGLMADCELSSLLEEHQNQETGLDSVYGNWDSSSSSILQYTKEWEANSSPEACTADGLFTGTYPPEATATPTGRRKRRRARSCKNIEEVENQRMTHIVVERNRRKQMNQYLAVLRSLMPASYVQRGDQASIVGGAINFVKELEQLLQSLEAQKQMTQQSEAVVENHSAIADIEVTMVESHANLKVLSRRRPKQLLKMVAGFQSLHLTILHLNVTTIDDMVLYTFSTKVEENCALASVDEIAAAVNQMLGRIQEEASMN